MKQMKHTRHPVTNQHVTIWLNAVPGCVSRWTMQFTWSSAQQYKAFRAIAGIEIFVNICEAFNVKNTGANTIPGTD